MNAIAANEPLSAQLRRLHEDINQLHSPSRSNRAVLKTLAALPALADLAEYVEKVATQPCHWIPMHEPGDDIKGCNPCEARRALAALRERLELR